MTYRELAVKNIMNKLEIDKNSSEEIIKYIIGYGQYKPCLFSWLDAPEELEDWDIEIKE